ncbi:hypothetical protein K435DRAFT_10224 [Dendrothele bispora CBS 962.96]|uniref:Uncharacterized protein n=1 Tax=Dendrothele bispora (strain CBS 962.96) TaxID=1314807 RepID=A0A4S8MZ42_DENBC|nr:hypothetical protein K435DRAFT_10224 [Dendrothele bispora CBS 962.96]
MPTRQDNFSHPMPPPPDAPHPFSLTAPDIPRLQSSLSTLQSLVDFYENERTWIYRQRVSVDDPPVLPVISPDIYTDEDPYSSQEMEIKAEPVEIPLTGTSRTHSIHFKPSETRWRRRKPDLKLKLHKLPPLQRIQNGAVRRNADPQSSSSEEGLSSYTECLPGIETLVRAANEDAHLLDIFEEMLEARLQSCQRIDRLVRDARQKSVSTIPSLRYVTRTSMVPPFSLY